MILLYYFTTLFLKKRKRRRKRVLENKSYSIIETEIFKMNHCHQGNKIPIHNSLHPNKPTIFVYNDITHDTVWTSDKNWVLMNRIHVINNSVLAIEEGTTVYANSPDYSDPRNPPSLIITIGSKLFAEGTCESPITFTSILSHEVIFALNNKKIWTYNGGLGPFSALWSGIYICGNNVSNLTLTTETAPINLPGTSVMYGGDITNTNNCVLSYVKIYFAGDSSITNSNSLTLAAPSYNCTLQNLEIMYGQGDAIAIYGGNALIKDSVFAFKYKGNYVSLKDGAQIALVHNIYMEGYSSVNPDYQEDVRGFLHIETTTDMESPVIRNSVANLSSSTFLCLGYIKYHVYTDYYGVFKTVNNVHIGPCSCVYSVPETLSSPYTFTTVCPTEYDQTQFYMGPIAYEQCNGDLYCGPAETLQNAYQESGQLLIKITYLTNGFNNQLLTCGKFLDIAPVPTSDVYKSISTDSLNSHVLPFICAGFFDPDQTLAFGLQSCKASFHASGAVESTCDQEFWCKEEFGRFLVICHPTHPVCPPQPPQPPHPTPCPPQPPQPIQPVCPPPHPTPCPCPPHPHPCPCPPHPHPCPCPPRPCYSESSSSSGSFDSDHIDFDSNENKTNDMITKGLVMANMAVMGYFLLKTITKASKK